MTGKGGGGDKMLTDYGQHSSKQCYITMDVEDSMLIIFQSVSEGSSTKPCQQNYTHILSVSDYSTISRYM